MIIKLKKKLKILILFLKKFVNKNRKATPISLKIDCYIQNVFSQLDIDKSGKITLDQFKKNWTKDPHFLEVCNFLNNGLHQTNFSSSMPAAIKNKEKEISSIDKHYYHLYDEIDELCEKLEGISYSLNKQIMHVQNSDTVKKENSNQKINMDNQCNAFRFGNSLYVVPIQMDGDENNFGKDETASNEEIVSEAENRDIVKIDEKHSFEFIDGFFFKKKNNKFKNTKNQAIISFKYIARRER